MDNIVERREPMRDAEPLAGNFAGWLKSASLREILVILSGLEDELIARRSPAASLVAQAHAMLSREIKS